MTPNVVNELADAVHMLQDIYMRPFFFRRTCLMPAVSMFTSAACVSSSFLQAVLALSTSSVRPLTDLSQLFEALSWWTRQITRVIS